uniref:Plant heme peroxidase family profile domain-containing protein n=1 Tax=Aegilops tauschii subsp. strangulata TaxID=200361 RepID=A0A453QKM7_AEGTS
LLKLITIIIEMASGSAALSVVAVAMAAALLALCGSTEAHTQFGAYNKTCPQAEDIVFKEMTAVVAKSPGLAGSLLRLFSVDCFVGVSQAHNPAIYL